ncbi:PREDICTED: cell wall protein DAN4-like, partial [Amphimedon queenslandica]|uniref:Fibronectin type-III domain-containing protein n=1 Tax=Amphimedon queenslandica TaxID=400682 RepID=A0AAN0J845_AMPQE
MATAGIYWCLVLTECLSLAVSTITSYEQSPPTACPGDKLVFACVTVTEGSVIWRLNGNNSQAALLANDSPPSTLGSFSLKVTQYNIATLEIVSTATSTSAPVSLNGTSIDCSGTGGASYQRRFISYGDVPESINNTTIDPINSNALIINWSASGSCIDNYTVTIISNSTFNESRTTNNTNITIDTLIIDTNTTITGLSPINEYYTVTIIPVNVIGYGPSVTVNVSITTTTSSITNIMMSTTEYITMQDKSSAMTALPTITETQLITTTETISSCPDTITSYEQSPPTACPGDKLVFTCVTVTEGSVIWRLNGNNSQAALLANDSPPSTLGSFSLKVTQYNIATLEIVSTATSTSAPVSLNGTSIDCSGNGGASYQRRFISYGDVPESIDNATIDPINISITTTTSSITNIMMSTTEHITMQDKSSAMTALPTITETQLITTTETISSCAD